MTPAHQTLDLFLSEQSNLLPAEREEVLSHFGHKSYAKGSCWVKAGAYCNEIAFVRSGAFRLYALVDGREVCLHFIFENMFMASLTSLVYEQPSKWYIEAIEDSDILTICRNSHFDLMQKYPNWLEFDNRLLVSAYTELENKMFSYLYQNAEERYRSLFTENPTIFIRVPLKFIASYLGVTPETLSRLRNNIAAISR